MRAFLDLKSGQNARAQAERNFDPSVPQTILTGEELDQM